MLGHDEVTERRACRVLGQARNTQRRKASVADDEPRLVKRIVWMASEYGRYGYRRITVCAHQGHGLALRERSGKRLSGAYFAALAACRRWARRDRLASARSRRSSWR